MCNKLTIIWTGLLGASLLALTACTGGDPANGTPAPTSSPPASTGLQGGAPPVPSPLNPAAIEAAPCSAITPEQVASLGLPQKSTEPHTDENGSCTWRFATGGKPSSFSGSLVKGVGLQSLYMRNQSGGLPLFEPFTASGYPAAVYYATANRPPGECALTAALRDDLGYTISVSVDPPLGDGCELGKKVAGFVVEYLKGKS